MPNPVWSFSSERGKQKIMGRKKNTRHIQALYSTIIFIIPSALIGGYFLGMKLDEQFNTDPWLTIIGVFLGGTGAFVELFRVLNRGERSSRRTVPPESNRDSEDSKKE
jgi:F0F1-type ATP synthase assembly protein I